MTHYSSARRPAFEDDDGTRYELDVFGRLVPVGNDRMMFPVRCRRCGNIHDSAKVEVTARYADCSCWKCPGCGTTLDDRPAGWGGSVDKLYE